MAKIRNHKERVTVAKKSDSIRTDGLKLSRLDLEAYVETLLIEDIRCASIALDTSLDISLLHTLVVMIRSRGTQRA